MVNILNSTDRRGFSGGQKTSQPNYKTFDGQDDVVKLWEDYVSPNNLTNTWAFKRRVLAVAIKCFHGSENWFTLQDRNNLINGHYLDFVLDTVRYIAIGRRRLVPSTWAELVRDVDPTEVNNAERKTILSLVKELGVSRNTTEMLQQWCLHPGGVDDMVWTLNILFGDMTITTPNRT